MGIDLRQISKVVNSMTYGDGDVFGHDSGWSVKRRVESNLIKETRYYHTIISSKFDSDPYGSSDPFQMGDYSTTTVPVILG
jgi:hypothetical protein